MARDINRRDFLKLSGGTVGLFATAGLFRGPLEPLVDSHIKQVEIRWGKETTTICPFCSAGCGLVCYSQDGELVRVEGDTAHPINHGSVCPKGGALAQIRNGGEEGSYNESRLKYVMYRASGSQVWEQKSWDFALERIARRIKDTRDQNWVDVNSAGRKVNRTEAIGSLGGSKLNNEECYLLSKMLRSLGIINIQNQVTDGPLSGVIGLNASLGCGAMTNHWTDLSNSDCILFIGANVAENHPPIFLHAKSAQDKGATIVDIDPRFTRTSAKSDIHCPARPGTDLAVLGGMVKHIIDDIGVHPENYNLEYITRNTDASLLIRPEFKGPAELNGLFSGFNTNTGLYQKDSWRYQIDTAGIPISDDSLNDPTCVFQHLKRHYSRYDIDTVSKMAGVSQELLGRVYRAVASTGQIGKAGAIVGSSGIVQQNNGTQIIRTLTIIQLLLANIGIAGGGVNVFGAESNYQGSLDHGLNSGILPGYMAVPSDLELSLSDYVTPDGDGVGLLTQSKRSTDIISLLTAWYGHNSLEPNDHYFTVLPKADRGTQNSLVDIFRSIETGSVKGMMIWGENPGVSSPDSERIRQALGNLEWMVVADSFENETATFWKRPGVNPGNIDTEVFLLPTAASFEKEGSLTNAGRWMQWSYKAVEPLGESKSELWIINNLMAMLQELYASEGGPNETAITHLTWGYADSESVAKEINGWSVSDTRLLEVSQPLSETGQTSCGNPLYKGSYGNGVNLAARRDIDPGGFIINLYHRWAWSWPNNTRILHNRASVDVQGKALDSKRTVIEWDAFNKRWIGDIPDGAGIPGAKAFQRNERGFGKLFTASLKDGPIPEYYEPWESPSQNLISDVQTNPVIKENGAVRGKAEEFPIIGTTFTIGEHWGSGTITRRIPWLLEMSPEPFIEIGTQLADSKRIESGDYVEVRTARGQIKMRALVTQRLRPFTVNGRDQHHVAIPVHWGFLGPAPVDSAQMLTSMVADANSAVAGTKVFLCDLRRGD